MMRMMMKITTKITVSLTTGNQEPKREVKESCGGISRITEH